MAWALAATHLALTVVDSDEEFIAHAREAFAVVPDVEVVHGPFDAAWGFGNERKASVSELLILFFVFFCQTVSSRLATPWESPSGI